jgi:hypothetical protein
MANPQQPELARSRKTPALDPDATEAVLSAAEAPTVDRPRGPVPVDNQPGHHPAVEQDKPSADRFLAKVKEVAAEAEADDRADADDGADAVEVGPSVEATTAARSHGAAPVPPVPPADSPAELAPSSPRAEGLAALAGAPWKLASGVLQRLRDRL